MKIAFVLDDTLDKSDGVQQYILTLGRYYDTVGHDVFYLVAETERKDIKNVHSLGTYVSLKFNHNNVRTPLPANKKEIKKLLDSLDLDVIHVQMPYSPLLASKVILSAGPRTRIVGTFHILPASSLHKATNYALALIIKQSLKKFNAIVAVSKPAAQFAKTVYGINAEVVPNCVDIARFTPKREILHKASRKRIVFLGRFVKRKGPEQMVRAVRELIADVDVNLLDIVMAGTGPELENVRELARAMGLSKVITFPGFIDEAKKSLLLSTADIAVFPSLGGESFGIVLIEAMASGSLVVLGGNNPGYESVLGDRPELLFDPRDPKEFADTLRSMLYGKHVKDITAWQKQHVKQYDVPVVANKLLNLYSRPDSTD